MENSAVPKDDKLLRDAAKRGRLDWLEMALQKGHSLETTFGRGWTALHYAAFKGHSLCVKRLLEVGADAGAVDTYGRVPLHWASLEGKLDCVSLLVASPSCGVNRSDNGGRTPLLFALKYDHTSSAKCILDARGEVLPVTRFLPVPPWVYRYRKQLSRCHCAARALSRVMQKHHAESKDVIPAIVGLVWQSRNDECWAVEVDQVEETEDIDVLF